MAKEYLQLKNKFEKGQVYTHIDTGSAFVYLGKCNDSDYDCLLRVNDGCVVVVTDLRYGTINENGVTAATGIWWSLGDYYDSIASFDALIYSRKGAEGMEKLIETFKDLDAIRDDVIVELECAENDKNLITGLDSQLATLNKVIKAFFGKTDSREIKNDIIRNQYKHLQSILF